MPTVLIVEDNAKVAKFYAMALTRAGGMEVARGDSGDEILRAARAGEADLILLDISLAGFTCDGEKVDGLDIARRLKENPATKAIPILLATAHAMEGDRERFLETSRADGYLQKPIYDPMVLVEKVRALLDRAGNRG